MDQQVHPERKEQGQPRIITAGKGRTGRYRHQQNQFFGSHGGKPQGGDPVEMQEHAAGELKFPSLESIAKFCKFYNISLEKFFAGITYPEEPQE